MYPSLKIAPQLPCLKNRLPQHLSGVIRLIKRTLAQGSELGSFGSGGCCNFAGHRAVHDLSRDLRHPPVNSSKQLSHSCPDSIPRGSGGGQGCTDVRERVWSQRVPLTTPVAPIVLCCLFSGSLQECQPGLLRPTCSWEPRMLAARQGRSNPSHLFSGIYCTNSTLPIYSNPDNRRPEECKKRTTGTGQRPI